MIASPRNTVLAVITLLLPIWAIARNSEGMELWQAAILILVIGGAFWMTVAYLSAIRKAHAASMLARPVWWGRFLWGHGLWMIFAVFVALLTGLSVVAVVMVQGLAAFFWIAMTAALVQVLARFFARPAKDDLRPFARNWAVIRLATLSAAAVVTVANVLWAIVPSAPGSIDALFDSASLYLGSSAAIALMTEWVTFLSGAQAMAEREATGQGFPLFLVLSWRVVAAYSYFFGIAVACAAPLIASAEARRILAPTDSDTPARVRLGSAAFASFLAVIVAVVLLQLLALLEASAMSTTIIAADDPTQPSAQDGSGPGPAITASEDAPQEPPRSSLSPAAIRKTIEAEIIGNLQCPPGTIAAIEEADAEFREILAGQEALLEIAISAGFDGVRANVPEFLDWYYSLTAEYLRTASLFTGTATEYLDDKLQDYLSVGSPLQGVVESLALTTVNSILAGAHGDRRSALLASCGLSIPRDDAVIMVTDSRPADLLTTDLPVEAIGLETRVTASLGGLAVGAAVSAIMVKIGAKAMAKPFVTLAAQMLVKIAGSKAISLGGGLLTGSLTGGAGGSVIPGLGTTAGAIVGGIIGGVSVMLAVDYSLLKLEEEISRADFQTEIMAAIDETEGELIAQLGLERP